MLELFEFDESIGSNIINDRSPTIKFLVSIILLVSIFIENEILPLTILFLIIFLFSTISQGIRRILKIYWSMRYYLILVIIVSLFFNDLRFDYFILITILKLISIFISFSFFSKTTTPERLIDVLIQLKIPPRIAWSVGVSFRQALLILEDAYYIQSIQRLRIGYNELNFKKKIAFRFTEIYTMLVSILARSIVISTEFAIAIKMRGFDGSIHKNIILDSSPIHISDYLFLILVAVLTLTIIVIV
ncbi:MAG: hypothetical protein GPJ54_01000 [Candidatus Heimdallarchaeota archaeon]|nr:hypothetical protein [Candidatus Heimdallarchaeota archaeon]